MSVKTLFFWRPFVARLDARKVLLCLCSGASKIHASMFRLAPILVLICFVLMQPTAAHSEAAFAIGQRGDGLGWAYSYNVPTKADAERNALIKCRRENDNCSIILTFRNTCFAFAVQDTGKGWGTDLGIDLSSVRFGAQLRCASTESSCSIRDELCDSVVERARQSDGQEYARWLAIFGTMQLFSTTALVVLFGWLMAACRTPYIWVRKKCLIVVASIGAPIAFGLLCRFSHHYEMLPINDRNLLFLSTCFETIGNGAAALFVGAWIGIRTHIERISICDRPPVFVSDAVLSFVALQVFLASGFVLAAHVKIDLRFDTPILIGIVLSWTFVLGYILSDPSFNPLLQRLDKLLVSADTQICRLFASAASTTYKALQSIYESMAAQRGMTSRSDLPAVVKLRSQALDLRPNQAPVPTEVEAGHLAIPTGSFSEKIQLKLKRSQRLGITGKVIFVVDARLELPEEEYSLVRKYKLGELVVFDSAARKRHTEAMKAHYESSKDKSSLRDSLDLKKQIFSLGKTFYRLARVGISGTMAGLSLRITINSLMSGVHVECKEMGELGEAEEAIVQAAETVRTYLNAAATFDGREVVLEF
jgi:hypothetical protein